MKNVQITDFVIKALFMSIKNAENSCSVGFKKESGFKHKKQ